MIFRVPVTLLEYDLSGHTGKRVAGVYIRYRSLGQIPRMLKRAEWEEIVKWASRGAKVDLDHPSMFFLAINMPCGNVAIYKRASDIPQETTPCLCGDPSHYLVYYEKISVPVPEGVSMATAS